ncbi:MAG: AMP-binding protein [Pseudomonadota bacterium]
MSLDDIKTTLSRGFTAIEASNSIEFLEAAFAAYDRGTVFSITRSDIDPTSFGVPVTEHRHATQTRGWVTLPHELRASDDPAQIVFTSGTEGAPKAIILTHRNLADVAGRLNDVMQVTSDIREYVGIPVTYSFGLGRARAVAAARGSIFLPERFDPTEIHRMLQTNEINAISAVPSLWRLILTAPEVIGSEGAKVRWIEIGSQYMSGPEKRLLRDLFPNARIVQHYGMTEASRTTFLVISDEDDPDRLESVGAIGDRVRLSSGGAIEVTGPHVSPARINSGGEMTNLIDGDGWLRTSDRGEIRDGYLFYLGRLDDQMNLGGIKVGAEAIEVRVAELVPEASGHFAVTSVPDPLRGEAVLLALEPPASDMPDLIEAALVQALREKTVRVGGAIRVSRLEQLPRTVTSKIKRAALRELEADATNRDPDSSDRTNTLRDMTEAEAKIAAIWRRVLGDVEIGPQNSFYDSGGDSLSGMQVGLSMEGAGLPRAAVNATFEGASLSEVAAQVDGKLVASDVTSTLTDQTRLTWSLTMTRAMVVLAVLLSHWGPGLLNVIGLPETLFISFTRLGTPGFAFVFGIGVGLYMLPEMSRNRQAVYHRADRAVLLVGIGAILMGLISLLYFQQRGDPINGLTIGNAFYSVLIYYTIMLATVRLWLPPLARLKAPVSMLLAGALVFWGLWQLMREVTAGAQLVSVLELGRLMAGAGGYNVFKLGTMTCAGMAIGYWIWQQKDLDAVRKRLVLVGGLGVVFCGAALLQAHGMVLLTQSTRMHTSLIGLGFYGSLCLLAFGIFLTLMPWWAAAGGVLRILLKVVLTFGGLALPIYVLHQFVIPIYKILEIQGVPNTIALAAPMAAFLVILLYLGQRVYRMYRA